MAQKRVLKKNAVPIPAKISKIKQIRNKERAQRVVSYFLYFNLQKFLFIHSCLRYCCLWVKTLTDCGLFIFHNIT